VEKAMIDRGLAGHRCSRWMLATNGKNGNHSTGKNKVDHNIRFSAKIASSLRSSQ